MPLGFVAQRGRLLCSDAESSSAVVMTSARQIPIKLELGTGNPDAVCDQIFACPINISDLGNRSPLPQMVYQSASWNLEAPTKELRLFLLFVGVRPHHERHHYPIWRMLTDEMRNLMHKVTFLPWCTMAWIVNDKKRVVYRHNNSRKSAVQPQRLYHVILNAGNICGGGNNDSRVELLSNMLRKNAGGKIVIRLEP